MKKALLLLACFFSICASVNSQDNHYGINQLGSSNAILSGASLSRWVDQTAVVNNPATMTFASGPGFTFSTTSASLEKINFRDALGTDVNVKSSNTIIYPGLIAGEIKPLKRAGKRTVGFAIYNNNLDRLRYISRVSRQVDLLNETDSPGEETYIGNFALDSDISETAGALGWSQRLSEHWSLGLAIHGFFRHHKYREDYSSKAITDPNSNAIVDVVGVSTEIGLQYTAALLQLKAGVAWQKDDWNVGLVITSPTVKVFSTGDLTADLSVDNILLPSAGQRQSFFANTFLEKLKPTYKYPLSVGAGISKKISSVQVSVAAVWHAALDRYLIIDPGNTAFLQPPSEDNILYTPDFLEVWSSNRSVVNLGASTSWEVKDSLNLLLGFRTDQHFAEFADENSPGFQLSKKIWNRQHVTLGFELEMKRSHWILGLHYTHGREDNFRQPGSFDGVSELNLFGGEPDIGVIRQNSIGAILSYFFQISR